MFTIVNNYYSKCEHFVCLAVDSGAEVVSAEGINSQDGTAESLQYIPVLFEVVCAEGINSAGDTIY